MAHRRIIKIDYKNAFIKSGKNYCVGFQIFDDGAELICNLLNDINNQLSHIIEQAFKSETKIYENTFYHCAKKAIENVFVGTMKEYALSEALRQLALFKNDYDTIVDNSGQSTLEKEPVSEKSDSEIISFKCARLNFGPAITDVLPDVFPNIQISLARDFKIKLSNILEDVCIAFTSHSISTTDSKELDVEEIKASVCELFPGLLKDLALSHGSKIVEIWGESKAAIPLAPKCPKVVPKVSMELINT